MSDRDTIERLTAENERLRVAGGELLAAFDWALSLVANLPESWAFDQAMGRARNGWTSVRAEGSHDG